MNRSLFVPHVELWNQTKAITFYRSESSSLCEIRRKTVSIFHRILWFGTLACQMSGWNWRKCYWNCSLLRLGSITVLNILSVSSDRNYWIFYVYLCQLWNLSLKTIHIRPCVTLFNITNCVHRTENNAYIQYFSCVWCNKYVAEVPLTNAVGSNWVFPHWYR